MMNPEFQSNIVRRNGNKTHAWGFSVSRRERERICIKLFGSALNLIWKHVMFHCHWDNGICLENIFWNISRLLNYKNYLKNNGVCKRIIKILKCPIFFRKCASFFTYTWDMKTWNFPGCLGSLIVIFTYVWICFKENKVNFILSRWTQKSENFDELIFCRQFWSYFWFSSLDFWRQFRKVFLRNSPYLC